MVTINHTGKVQSALDSGLSQKLLNEGMVAMAEVGRLFEEGEYYVPGDVNFVVLCRPQWGY
jgi:methanogenic corrinoid protein MtbC1